MSHLTFTTPVQYSSVLFCPLYEFSIIDFLISYVATCLLATDDAQRFNSCFAGFNEARPVSTGVKRSKNMLAG